MTQKWIETKVTFLGEDMNGVEKKQSRSYVVLSDNFSDAEHKTFLQAKDLKEVSVCAVKTTKIYDIIACGDDWSLIFKVKMDGTFLTEKGVEKKTTYTILVKANSIDEALKYAQKHFSQWDAKYISETKIEDVVL